MKRKKFVSIITETTVRAGFEKFINAKIALNRAKDTIDYYNQRFEAFCKFLEEKKGIRLARDLTEDIINEYVLYKRKNNPNISSITINTELRAIRAVLYYFMDKGFTPSFSILLISAKKSPKECYTQEEQEQLIKKPNTKNCSFPEYRNWVIICHLMASGNRSKTIRGIKIKHVNLQERYILLDEVKNNQIYEIPISNEYYPILSEYMNVRQGEPEEYLFCSQYGSQLSAGGLRAILRKYNLSRGITTTGIHRFRHTFAKSWIMEGGSAKKLQYALGHSDPKMVDEYIRLYGRDLQEDFSQLTPLSHLKDKIEGKKAIMKRGKI